MPRDRLKALNPVEYQGLRQYAVHGVMPLLKTLSRFIAAGLVEPRTFTLRPGVLDEIAAKEAFKKRVHLLNPEQLERAIKARKDCPIQ